eukprot:COSAG02_NODE_6667_length_3429_cov_3.808390_3_plen_403_part_00
MHWHFSRFKNPIAVVRLFLLCVWDLVLEYGSWAIKHPYTQKVVLPGAVAWYVAYQIEGAHKQHMNELTKTVEYIIWWVGLGVLSSVGLGSGMHTGILFLFPHVFKVTNAIENMATLCPNPNNSSDIDPRDNMWARLPIKESFPCLDTGSSGGDGTAMFLHIYLHCLPAAFLWGAGTAIGEVPPYWTAFAAKMSGEVDEDDAGDIDEVEQLKQHDGAAVDPLTATKIWMINFMDRFGFWGVFIMSAWPNALFDLCGICCGTCLMPFWQFFSACWLGKACVKAPAQLVVLVLLFSETYRETYVEATKAFLSRIPVLGEGLATKLQIGVEKLRDTAEKGEHGQGDEETGGFTASDVFAWAMFLLIASFALSCIEQFAQAQQRSYDEKVLEAAGIKTKSTIKHKKN